MEILILGTESNAAEGRLKFSGESKVMHAANVYQAGGLLSSCDVAFDFTIHENASRLSAYQAAPQSVVFLDTTTVSLGNLLKTNKELTNTVFGFCGLPTFFNREILEVVLRTESDRKMLDEVCGNLKTNYQVVADQVGMVTPRVICMIINEAYYTLEEGTATREDIDLAMKLGTNYPWGPFEWGARIGLDNVSRLLNAVREETHDERYQVCPLLTNGAG
ncbi:MAG: 3-hydroxyacyl-CoA dehydrogenase family protein [Cytophagales bacterium]|nr:3-hydroxyacyl-CoA dehydrogenase family protein [Cytophagales bacterium]